MQKKYLVLILLAVVTTSVSTYFYYRSSTTPLSLEQQREHFLKAEQLITANKTEDFLTESAKLQTYPLYPYLQYQWLKHHLSQTELIRHFLARYKGNHYAELLRNQWLTKLAEQQKWSDFIEFYQDNDDKSLQCQFHWAKYQTDDKRSALKQAQHLWQRAEPSPETCKPLFASLMSSSSLASEAIWQHFINAIKTNQHNEASATLSLLDKDSQIIANKWLQVHNKPDIIQQAGFFDSKNDKMAALFSYGIERLIKPNLSLALSLWDKQKHVFPVEATNKQAIEQHLTLTLAMRRDSRAFERFKQLTAPDAELRTWGLRSALFTRNWQGIIQAFEQLSSVQQDIAWQYWYARALTETGRAEQAKNYYATVAKDRSFYGFLAADAMNQPYQFNDQPIALTDETLENFRQTTDIKALEELLALERHTEAKRYWPQFIKKLTKVQITLAAKLAQRWHWQQTAIVTLTKADYWDDLTLRFPVAYQTEVETNAALQQIDPAVIFGLMRQESMMDSSVVSVVGAKGLMQLMPSTGQHIAQALKENWQSSNDLFNPDLNIKYGSYYYKQLLNQFNGQFALAIAAYNAGPSRVKKWLPNKAMPVDLWIELIPFKETRKYVSSVLTYAMIYQYRLQKNTLRLKNLLPDVTAIKN